jgi:uncharacterized protein YecE (DUF72 family)
MSSQDLSAKVPTLKKWRQQAPKDATFVARIDAQLVTNNFASNTTQEIWSKALRTQEALQASALLLHTPSSFRPSQENEAGLRSWLSKVELPCPLIWRADGLWEESDYYFDVCQSLKITPVIDPLMWDEEDELPTGAHYYWRILGGQGLTPRLGDYELDQLLSLVEDHEHSGWVVFSSPHMMQVARRWRNLSIL